MTTFEFAMIPIYDIITEKRHRKDYGDIQDLASSIKSEGLINPIAIKPLDGKYKLLAGGRRLTAMMLLEWPEVPCHIYPEDTDDLTAETIELNENIKRKSLTWAEEVEAVQRIHNLYVAKYGQKVQKSPDAPGHSMRDTAKMLNLSPTQVSDDIAIADSLKLIPELKDCKNKSEASRVLEKIKTNAVIKELADRITSGNVSIDDKKKALISKYVIGDFFDGVAKLPAEHFHLIECDPPYGVDYSTNDRGVGDRAATTRDYNEVEAHKYQEFLDRLIKECYRVLSPTGWMIFWYADDPWGEVVYQALVSNGFIVPRYHPMWYKGSGQTLNPDKRLAGDYASFFYCRKGNAAIAKPGHGLVFECPPLPPNKKVHPTERPVELLQDILTTFATPGSRVLIPFLGSGATMLAAINATMDPIGFELSQQFKDAFTVRVQQSTYGSF